MDAKTILDAARLSLKSLPEEAKRKTFISDLDKLYEKLFSGGKAVRARLVQETAKEFGLSLSERSLLCSAVELIHHSSILHDDVIDSSSRRRGHPSAWVHFSRNKAILAGDYLLAEASFKLSEYGNTDLLKLTAQTVKKMIQGEWLQSEKLKVNTLKGINEIHVLKTSALFEWCLLAPFLCLQPQRAASLQEPLKKAGRILGQLFQRADDAMDFGVRNKENKEEFKDLNEGYLNFFGVFLKENAPLDERELLACGSRYDFKKIMTEQTLEKQIRLYDEMNQKLILSFYEALEALSSLSEDYGPRLAKVLKSWAHDLYFRS